MSTTVRMISGGIAWVVRVWRPRGLPVWAWEATSRDHPTLRGWAVTHDQAARRAGRALQEHHLDQAEAARRLLHLVAAEEHRRRGGAA